MEGGVSGRPIHVLYLLFVLFVSFDDRNRHCHCHTHQHHHDDAWRRQWSARGGRPAHSCGHCGETLWVPTTKPGGAQLLYVCTFVYLYIYAFELSCLCISVFLCVCTFVCMCVCVKTVWLPTRARGSSQGARPVTPCLPTCGTPVCLLPSSALSTPRIMHAAIPCHTKTKLN